MTLSIKPTNIAKSYASYGRRINPLKSITLVLLTLTALSAATTSVRTRIKSMISAGAYTMTFAQSLPNNLSLTPMLRTLLSALKGYGKSKKKAKDGTIINEGLPITRRETPLLKDLGITDRTVPGPTLLSRTLSEITIHRVAGFSNTNPVLLSNSSVNNDSHIILRTLLNIILNPNSRINIIGPVTKIALWLRHLVHNNPLSRRKTTFPLLSTLFCVKTWPLMHAIIMANQAINGKNALKHRTRTRPRSMPFKPGIKIPLLIVNLLLIIDPIAIIINTVLIFNYYLLMIKRKSKMIIQSRATPMPPIR